MYRIAVCEDEKYILEELHQKVETSFGDDAPGDQRD